MWLVYVIVYIIFMVIFTQSFKVITKTSKNIGALTVLTELLTGVCILVTAPFFGMNFSTDWKVYVLLLAACVFYAVSDRMNTTVRKGIEASTFSIIQQLSTVFMIVAGFLFFHEAFIWQKFLGAALIIFSNVLIFYQKGKQKIDRYVILGIIANLAFSAALFIDVNLSEDFNLAIYKTLAMFIPAFMITVAERIKFSEIKREFVEGNKKFILITCISWGITVMSLLLAYQLGEVTIVAPLCAINIIGNVIVGWIFLKERDHLPKKVIAAILIVISVLLING